MTLIFIPKNVKFYKFCFSVTVDADLASEMACVLTRERLWKNSNVLVIALNFKNHYFPLKK